MTFEEILDQALAMLQRRGRVTYSALKRQFNLDDAFLEDLKEELLYGQRLAVEEDGRVLVWIGRCEYTPRLDNPGSTAAGKRRQRTAHTGSIPDDWRSPLRRRTPPADGAVL